MVSEKDHDFYTLVDLGMKENSSELGRMKSWYICLWMIIQWLLVTTCHLCHRHLPVKIVSSENQGYMYFPNNIFCIRVNHLHLLLTQLYQSFVDKMNCCCFGFVTKLNRVVSPNSRISTQYLLSYIIIIILLEQCRSIMIFFLQKESVLLSYMHLYIYESQVSTRWVTRLHKSCFSC